MLIARGCVMNRDEALQTLGLRGEADWHAIERAYWTKVRAAQGRAGRDGGAASEVEALNEAYAALSPTGAERPRRNPEIALMLGASIALALFALVGGAGAVYVAVPLAVVFLAAWAPWRAEADSPAERGGRRPEGRERKRAA
jgi:hypothetical protein